MDLCTLSTVKALLGMEDETTLYDHVLQHLVTAISGQIERYLDRTVLSGTYTQRFSIEPGASVFAVKAYPVTAVTSVKNAIDWTFSATTSISTSYIDYETHPGLIYVYGQQLNEGYGALQIVYTGGMADNTAELEAGDYADVSLACEEQVIAVWQNRRNFGVQSASVSGSSAMYGSITLLESVKELLEPHRRRSIV